MLLLVLAGCSRPAAPAVSAPAPAPAQPAVPAPAPAPAQPAVPAPTPAPAQPAAPAGLTPNWQHRGERWLVVAVPTDQDTLDQLHRIDLKTGADADFGRLPAERFRLLAVSPDERYLGIKHAWLPYGLELVDLETGARTVPGKEAQPGGFAWAPEGSRWAARAAQEGSGLPVSLSFRWVEGATHVDIGDGIGEVRHLHPPTPLVLVGGPVWSPDGARIAVAAGIVAENAGQPEEQSVWSVTIQTNAWVKLYDLKPGETLSGRRQSGTLWP